MVLTVADGAGLACGVYCHLLSMGNRVPKTLVATHYQEIFERNFITEGPQLAFGHMEVRLDMHSTSIQDQVTYLYKYDHAASRHIN